MRLTSFKVMPVMMWWPVSVVLIRLTAVPVLMKSIIQLMQRLEAMRVLRLILLPAQQLMVLVLRTSLLI